MPPPKRQARSWIIVLSGIESVHWVLTERKMGFAASRRREVGRLREGDGIFFYATKGTVATDGVLFASGHAASGLTFIPEPYKVAKREIELECQLTIEGVAERGEGVPIAELVPKLRLFAGYGQPSSWRALLQRPLVTLYDDDPEIITAALQPVLKPPTAARLAKYSPAD